MFSGFFPNKNTVRSVLVPETTMFFFMDQNGIFGTISDLKIWGSHHPVERTVYSTEI